MSYFYYYRELAHNTMIPGSKDLNPHELAHKWGRIVEVRST